MEASVGYDIPLETLAGGAHQFDYVLGNDFFEAFETDLIRSGDFTAQVTIEKVRNQFNLAIAFAGNAGVVCDRCLEPFRLPLAGEGEIVIKYDAELVSEDDEVIYVAYGTERYNVAKLLFENIAVALPMSVVHDLAGLDCDPAMLKYLNQAPETDSIPADGIIIPADSPWAALQALKGPNLN